MKLFLTFAIFLVFDMPCFSQASVNHNVHKKTISVPEFIANKQVDSLLSSIFNGLHITNGCFELLVVYSSYKSHYYINVAQIKQKGAIFRSAPSDGSNNICGFFKFNQSTMFIKGRLSDISFFFKQAHRVKTFDFEWGDTFEMPTNYLSIFKYSNGVFSSGAEVND